MTTRKKSKRKARTGEARRSSKRTVTGDSKRQGKPRRRASSKAQPDGGRRWSWLKLFGGLFLIGSLLGVTFLVYLDITIRKRFEARDWAVPAHIHSRPLEIYAGLRLKRDRLRQELIGLGFRQTETLQGAGTFRFHDSGIEIATRKAAFWDEQEDEKQLRITFSAGRVSSVQNQATGEDIVLTRLEPRLLGSVSAAAHEDRDLIKLGEAPELFIKALLVVEDRGFFSHHGIDPRGLARAMVANIRAGRFVQGGSTITQQLIKNLYLNSDRTLKRKFTEIFMALLLELHYDKGEILEAYLNEVFLGQAGNRAIHGFGLASRFYFGRPLVELGLEEIATLVGMIRGPSYYDPRRRPERVRKRRNVVLDEMVKRQVLEAQVIEPLKENPIRLRSKDAALAGSYPAFQELVRRKLREDYRAEDLGSDGLAVYTTLDPLVQSAAESALASRLESLEQERKLEDGSLQGAVVVVRVDNGEVLALVGGRRRGYAGFNRALDARRPIGSLVKPMVLAAALEDQHRYTLATLVNDEPLEHTDPAGNVWAPQNFDKTYHGPVSLLTTLAKSHNVPTAMVGLDIGVDKVIDVLRRSGVTRELDAYPSLLLGAISLTPIEVAQSYQVIANNGFRIPLRAILAVLSQEDQPVARYPLAVETALRPEVTHLVEYAMQEVVSSGTARGLNKRLNATLGLAGKTGTTDDFRDSWFAGFGGDYLAVVWVGRDDNKSTGLTGAAGAMQVFADIMLELDVGALIPRAPENIEFVSIDPATGLLADSGCENSRDMPFIAGSAPYDAAPCATSFVRGARARPRSDSIDVQPDRGNRSRNGLSGWLNRVFGDGTESARPRD